MKRFIVMALVKHKEAVLEKYDLYLRVTYGDGNKDVGFGPCSYKEYVGEMMRSYSWMDPPCIYAFSLATQSSITVVYSDSLTIEAIRGAPSVQDVDFCLVYNGYNHFVGAGNYIIMLHCNEEDNVKNSISITYLI